MPRVTLGSFSLDAPGTWTLSTVILAGPLDEGTPGAGMPTTKAVQPFQRNLVCTMEDVDPSMTADGYVKRQIDGLRQANVKRQEAAKPEKVKVGGHEGLLTEQIILGATGERVRQLQLVCIVENVAHTIIASHLDGPAFEGARKEFRAMLLSFEPAMMSAAR